MRSIHPILTFVETLLTSRSSENVWSNTLTHQRLHLVQLMNGEAVSEEPIVFFIFIRFHITGFCMNSCTSTCVTRSRLFLLAMSLLHLLYNYCNHVCAGFCSSAMLFPCGGIMDLSLFFFYPFYCRGTQKASSCWIMCVTTTVCWRRITLVSDMWILRSRG